MIKIQVYRCDLVLASR